MKNLRFIVALLLIGAVIVATSGVGLARAERAVSPVAQASAQGGGTTLKVTVVLSRFAGEKKILSLPFVLMVVAGDERATTVQMSSEIPVPQSDGKSYNYRPLGTNISMSARAIDGGLFNVSMTLSDSQVLLSEAGAVGESLRGLARFQSFSTSPRLILRDGQTIQYAAATDKMSGDVVKVDVTLNVIK